MHPKDASVVTPPSNLRWWPTPGQLYLIVMHLCVFGGQYGSEGKGSVSEHLLLSNRYVSGVGLLRKWTVIGENAPNSGHTCTAGSVRSLPAASFFADRVILGPDAVIDPPTLMDDILKIQVWRATQKEYSLPQLPMGRLEVHIHSNAAWLQPIHREMEANLASIKAISSTGSGSGAARYDKYYHRKPDAVMSAAHRNIFDGFDVRICHPNAWLSLVDQALCGDCLFECSQGFLLDTNFGIYPCVTSRSTSPRVAIERNGFGNGDWVYCSVMRTYPIRTGGPSGPTMGKEVTFESLGVIPEIATVTKRTRRIFEFSIDEFIQTYRMTRFDRLYITHTDYLLEWAKRNYPDYSSMNFAAVVNAAGAGWVDSEIFKACPESGDLVNNVWVSYTPGFFTKI